MVQSYLVYPTALVFLTFCWIKAGSRTHDGHVHYVYQNEAFLKNTQLRRGTSQVEKTENGKLPAVKGKPACARVNVHRLHLVGLEIATFGAPFADMRIYGVYGVGTSKQSVRTCSCDSLCAKMTVGIGNQGTKYGT